MQNPLLLTYNYVEHIVVSLDHIKRELSRAQVLLYPETKVVANDFKITLRH